MVNCYFFEDKNKIFGKVRSACSAYEFGPNKSFS